MRFSMGRAILMLGILALVFAGTVNAAPVGYTDYAAFEAALPMGPDVRDLGAYGDIIASGAPVDGISFTYDFGTFDHDGNPGTDPIAKQMMVDGYLDLGTNDSDMLLDGDEFDMIFTDPVSAIGMYFITGDPLYEGDIMLTVGTETVGLAASAVFDDDPDVLAYFAAGGVDIGGGWSKYFLGIVDADPAGAFTSASVSNISGGYFTYTVNNITTSAPVPEPTTMLLLGTGLIGLAGCRRRMKKIAA